MPFNSTTQHLFEKHFIYNHLFYNMKIVKLFLAITTVVILSSCGEQCTTCTFTYEIAGQSVSAAQPEFCGSGSEVSDYKDGLQASADAAATAAGAGTATFTCVDD